MAEETTTVEAPKVELATKTFEANDGDKVYTITVFEMAGKTKGKGSRDIKYWNFDTDKPETLPKNVEAFKNSTKFMNADTQNPEGVAFDGPQLLNFMIGGFNDWAYNLQADEIREYLNPAWSDEIKANFRISVRNTAKMLDQSIEETATFLRPMVDKAWEKAVAKFAEAQKSQETVVA